MVIGILVNKGGNMNLKKINTLNMAINFLVISVIFVSVKALAGDRESVRIGFSAGRKYLLNREDS